jgi:hypothetical protein
LNRLFGLDTPGKIHIDNLDWREAGFSPVFEEKNP